MPLQLIVNGDPRSLQSPEPKTLQELVVALQMNPAQVAIEHNGVIVRRADWPAHSLSEGDRLEIVQFVGGGVG